MTDTDPAVELVARTLCAGIGATGFRCAAIIHEEHRNAAREVLTALRRDGSALPPVVQTREEAGHWSPNKSYVWACRGGGVDPNDHRYCELPISHVRTISTLADDGSPYGGATLTGKWRNVDG